LAKSVGENASVPPAIGPPPHVSPRKYRTRPWTCQPRDRGRTGSRADSILAGKDVIRPHVPSHAVSRHKTLTLGQGHAGTFARYAGRVLLRRRCADVWRAPWQFRPCSECENSRTRSNSA